MEGKLKLSRISDPNRVDATQRKLKMCLKISFLCRTARAELSVRLSRLFAGIKNIGSTKIPLSVEHRSLRVFSRHHHCDSKRQTREAESGTEGRERETRE